MIDSDFSERCVFVCVDMQEGTKPDPMTEESLHEDWRAMGFTVDDVNAATDFGWGVALPNVCRVAEACRALCMPMIFLHWGFQHPDGMDLEPTVRKMMLRNHGKDYEKWPGHVSQPGARPAKCLNIRPGDYVLPKTAQDAFISSNLGFVLANLGARNLVFVGGHTEACLGKTARSARRRGYKTLCVHDATSNARESTRIKGIDEARFDLVVTTAMFAGIVDRLANARVGHTPEVIS